MSPSPKFAVATTTMGRMYDVAAEMQKRDLLARLLSGYPPKKLVERGLDPAKFETSSLPTLMQLGTYKVLKGRAFRQATEPYPKLLFDRWAAKHLPADGNVLFATSSMCLLTGREAKKRGMLWLCDRPSTHIVAQNEVLTEEYALQGMKWPGISQTVIDQELREYDEADYVVVRSSYAARSFVERGHPADRIWRISHGVNLERFKPVGEPEGDTFEVLFVGQLSHRKGVRYAIEAFRKLDAPRKRLTFVGSPSEETAGIVAEAVAKGDVRTTGVVPQKELPAIMSKADVMILPSLEEGLALVLSQAMACGCPVIATPATGIEDLMQNGEGGFIVPERDVDALAAKMQALADDRELRRTMREKARTGAIHMGGWPAYVDDLVRFCATAQRRG